MPPTQSACAAQLRVQRATPKGVGFIWEATWRELQDDLVPRLPTSGHVIAPRSRFSPLIVAAWGQKPLS